MCLRHLRRAVVDHVSDAFLDTTTPLLILIDAAKRRDSEATTQAGHLFLEHANKIVDVSLVYSLFELTVLHGRYVWPLSTIM